MENVQEIIMQKMLGKLSNQITNLSVQLAEALAKNELYLETLQAREQELQTLSKQSEKEGEKSGE